MQVWPIPLERQYRLLLSLFDQMTSKYSNHAGDRLNVGDAAHLSRIIQPTIFSVLIDDVHRASYSQLIVYNYYTSKPCLPAFSNF